jgi:mRNA-degrading endonuclease YafQ of YafQ-DinJ toxin-antitoxin module
VVKVGYSKKFLKQYYKLPPKIQSKFQSRLQLWIDDPYNPQLHLHMLTGEYVGLYSINVTGDIRALYEKINDTYVVFGLIGTHSQLYE